MTPIYVFLPVTGPTLRDWQVQWYRWQVTTGSWNGTLKISLNYYYECGILLLSEPHKWRHIMFDYYYYYYFSCCLRSSYLNMSPRPFSIPFLALILSFSLSRSFFLSFPIFFRSLLSWLPFICLSSEWEGWSLEVDTDSLPERELSSVSSSTKKERKK